MSSRAPDLAFGALRDKVITPGANLSNHAREAAAARTGLGVILLEHRADYADEAYTRSSNVFLDHIPVAPTRSDPGGTDMAVVMEDVTAELRTSCHYVCQGNGLPAEGMVEAIAMPARTEAVLLDPVYSGKGKAGLIDLRRQGYSQKGENVVLLRTSGSIGLFGYTGAFDAVMPA